MTDNVTTGDGATRGRRPRPATTGTSGAAYTPGATGARGSATAGETGGITGRSGPAGPGGPTDTMGTTGTHDTREPLAAGHERGDARTEGLRTGASAAGSGGHLLPHEETDKLNLRLQHAVGGFVDEPRSAVEEADHVLEEAASRFTDAVNQRRRTLRATWQTTGEERTSSADTEQLRLALRDYRELTERLLRI